MKEHEKLGISEEDYKLYECDQEAFERLSRVDYEAANWHLAQINYHLISLRQIIEGEGHGKRK